MMSEEDITKDGLQRVNGNMALERAERHININVTSPN
jgi:hypothetical protein